ncbi:MAG: hypothetical protein ACUVR8_03845 [Acidobacteriota bacterium]
MAIVRHIPGAADSATEQEAARPQLRWGVSKCATSSGDVVVGGLLSALLLTLLALPSLYVILAGEEKPPLQETTTPD